MYVRWEFAAVENGQAYWTDHTMFILRNDNDN
jgi:hypothetical protein